MRLRIRHKDGQAVINQDETSTLLELKDAIAKQINVPASTLELKSGYPPKLLVLSVDGGRTLSNLGMRDGEMIVTSEIADSSSISSLSAIPKVPSGSSGSSFYQTQTPLSTIAPKPTPHAPTLEQQQQQQQQLLQKAGIAASRNNKDQVPSVPIHNEGIMVVREVADDNSCLFNAIATLLDQGKKEKIFELRKIIVDHIQKDEEKYSSVLLGRPRQQYCEWIMRENSWGGAIELSIFSDHYQIEIASVDVATGRADRFGEGNYSQQVILMYSGIHYDAVALSPGHGIDSDCDQTQFDASSDVHLEAAKKLSTILKQQHKYTDLANFTLRCSVCQLGLRGEKEAQAHAQTTGHTNFEEYK